MEEDDFDIYIILCSGCENVFFLKKYVEKRKGEHNTADIGTEAVSVPVLMRHLKSLRMEWRDGR